MKANLSKPRKKENNIKEKCISILLNSIKDSLGKKREEISINFYLIQALFSKMNMKDSLFLQI